MNENVLVFRSVTYAQRASRALQRKEISNWVIRVPPELTKSGCGYAVRIRARQLAAALQTLEWFALRPLAVFGMDENGYYEVNHDLS